MPEILKCILENLEEVLQPCLMKSYLMGYTLWCNWYQFIGNRKITTSISRQILNNKCSLPCDWQLYSCRYSFNFGIDFSFRICSIWIVTPPSDLPSFKYNIYPFVLVINFISHHKCWHVVIHNNIIVTVHDITVCVDKQNVADIS